jgi:hypothetical protein
MVRSVTVTKTHGAGMQRSALRDLKRQAKCLRELKFMPLRRGRLPRPFDMVNIFCERCGIRIVPDDEQLL